MNRVDVGVRNVEMWELAKWSTRLRYLWHVSHITHACNNGQRLSCLKGFLIYIHGII